MGQPSSKPSRSLQSNGASASRTNLSQTSPSSARARSDAIDRQITLDSKRYKKECKILLLGSGESGKSTIVKQMKVIHQGGFDERERAEYRTVIYRNVLDCAGTLARVVRRVGVAGFDDDFPPSHTDGYEGDEGGEAHGIERGQGGGGAGKMRAYAESVIRAFPPVRGARDDPSAADDLDSELGYSELGHSISSSMDGDTDVEIGLDPVPFTRADERQYDYARSGLTTPLSPYSQARPTTADRSTTPAADVLAQTHATLTPALADALWHVARAPAVQRMVDENPADFYLMDSAGYFFSQIHRIATPTYVPSEEDVLRARAKSTAIVETRFWMGDLRIHMFDVGGQRSERKKWIHCFESVTSIIFCTALSEYDQVLEEERRVNRMRESLYLFESVINSRWFLRTSVILFLNKIDVFKRKLPKIPLGRYFPEYAGGNDLQKAAKYILWKFMQENRAKLTVYPHVTQATNTKNIRLVFAAVKETILQNALKDSGIL
ncbi:putative G protein alpha subunit GNA-3 [Mycena polygramma]|nr:putative G protein alpha subunit GNA-3 [Mycena polygramma]